MAEIGLQLKRAREQLGLSLSDMQRMTKIHLEYLRALEEDQFDILPSPFYVRAFLRTYALSLGLDAKPLLDRYEWLSAGGMPSTPRLGYISREDSPQNQTRSEGIYPTRTDRFLAPAPPTTRLPMRQHTGGRRPIHTEGISAPQSKLPDMNEPRALFPTPSNNPNQQIKKHQTPQRMRSVPAPREQQVVPFSPSMAKDQSTTAASPAAKGSATKRTLPGEPAKLKSSSDSDQLPLAPRRTLEAARSARGKKSASRWKTGVAAIGALLLVSAAALYLLNSSADADKPSKGSAATSSANSETSGGGSSIANANETEKLKLALVKSGSDMEGDLYELSGREKIEVVIKAKKGSCSLRHSEKTGGDGENYTLKAGDQKKITASGGFLWFRLGTPSNVEILVNGESIDTMAQDVAKSYRIQIKK